MNLQQMRDFVRLQLDLDDTDLPDLLLDTYVQEGYDRVLELEQRWPFFESEWPVETDATGAATMPVDASVMEMVITPDGRLLSRIPTRLAVLKFPPGQSSSGNPTCWTGVNRAFRVLPAPGSATDLTVYGFRMGSDWIAIVGASGECDCDRRLHIPICWYACSLGYANQEDEVLEATYLNRFKESSAQARDAIMRSWTGGPKQVNYTHYPTTGTGPGGPAQLVINVPGP
jgi:hypothetical protein